MRTMLERFQEKNFGKYDRFRHRLDESFERDGGRCHYCNTKLTTDPFLTDWNVGLAKFHHDAQGELVTVCRKCNGVIHGDLVN